jgi:NAD(P)-dependent dehydrogenase (short-subunit alcohol dehydrogenase family)
LGWATGRHALITGGGTGIGAATARRIAHEGAKVSLIGRRREPLEEIARQSGGKIFPADMTDRSAMEAAFGEARAANGPFDYVILNAGIGDSAPFLRTKRDAWDRIIATNLTALFDGAQLTLPDLIEGEDKRLIIVASVAGLRGAAYAAPYVASKHGAIGLMKSLAIEYARTGLTVNAVCPAFVDTPMVDDSAARISKTTGRSADDARAALAAMNANGRLVTSEEVADAIAFLCQPSSRSITGSALTVDGGTTA